MNRRLASAMLAGICLALAAMPAISLAQSFPAKPVRLVVPYPAGGLTDVLSRAIAAEIVKTWGQQLLVENRPGANGIIAAELVAKSAPDGYTLLMVDKTTIALNPALYTKLPYDPARDLTAVINLTASSSVLVAHPAFPANTLQELIALAREKPGQVNYGTFGLGSIVHVDTEALSSHSNIKLNHIPYKGVAEVMPAVASGQVQIALAGIPPTLGLIKQGKIKAIALAGPRRSSVLPDVPTFAEAGVTGVESRSWFGLVAPTGVPRATIEKLAADLGKVISAPEFQEKFVTGVGMELLNQPPDVFAGLMKADRAYYAALIKNMNLKLD
ncbi:MAG: Bug family tripartite tricarboxylate transporter substrate binding protein [Burkholderiales bacterium]